MSIALLSELTHRGAGRRPVPEPPSVKSHSHNYGPRIGSTSYLAAREETPQDKARNFNGKSPRTSLADEPRIYEVEPLQEYELVSQLRVPGWEQIPALWPAPIPEAGRALRPALTPEPGVALPPALPSLPRFQRADDGEVAPIPLRAVGPLAEGVEDERGPIDHRHEEAVEAIDSYKDDDPAERDPPLPPDAGHEYRPYRVGRNPGLLENINEGNILPVRTRTQRRVAALSIVSTRKVLRREPELIASVSTRHPPLPKTFRDAMASPEAESWCAASVKELNSMGLHKVFKLSRPPTGARAQGYRWVFTRKEDAEGNIISYKARLVVQGFAPRLGLDYNKTFAPVSSITTIFVRRRPFCRSWTDSRTVVLTSRRRYLSPIGSLSSALACFLR
ncbi:BZ3500_MvSof-1268-A1-R1_Chr11-1g03173 [Microbotryum saponariae]|uniref:BZ3500_MvSof-1268-A1-R1_Chr11-1g03173 protein n=1 Tax=Microbotryum saponariae TaxID=289078 RepID=A0A2X0LCM9_9BASI|nr:BZ3501_MvSof-1269-A2-R1_Chr11g02748 [Microbotryum saponariae]SDA03733.1 BZ3500_MvSof-1268-A1-R1_Chr11-1g03173 [Microbotryum saponariae]